MKKSQGWLALVLALALVANTLAPISALARGGTPIRPIDDDDPPMPQVEETGDPDPDSGGLTIQLDSFSTWRELLIASLRAQFAQALAHRSSVTKRDRAAMLSIRRGGAR